MSEQENAEKLEIELLKIYNRFPSIFNIRRMEPHYSNRADYNTNSKSYYDYLARYNYALGVVSQMLQRLLDRNIEVNDTATIDFTKIGDWIDNGKGCCQFDDIIKLKADVKLSDEEKQYIFEGLNPDTFTVENSIEVIGQEGLWSPDFTNVLKTVGDNINNINDRIDQLINSLSVNGKIEVPREINISGNDRLVNKVDLGEVTADTRIAITWRNGSTRRTDSYTVSELRGINAHIFGNNFVDDTHGGIWFEAFTRIVDGNKLWITTEHALNVFNPTGTEAGFNWRSKAWDENGTVYYDTQNPDYVSATNGQGEIRITKVVVYDLVDPISVD